MLRLRSEIWVQAYIRRCYRDNVPALVVYRGDSDAGAIYIKVNGLSGTAWVYGPAPMGFDSVADNQDRQWCASFGPEGRSDKEADAYVARQREMDQDLWLIEVEDREGRHFLGNALIDLT